MKLPLNAEKVRLVAQGSKGNIVECKRGGKAYELKKVDAYACDGCAFLEHFGADSCSQNDKGLFCEVNGHNIWIEKATKETKDCSEGMILPTESEIRKQLPITTGVLDYFPRAIAEVAKASYNGNLQHHANKPLHWDRTKSFDHADCISRHLIDRGKFDTDGIRHSAKLAWRALALLELELEEATKQG